jgi:hypothetical protein
MASRMRVDLVINSIGLILIGLEFILTILVVVNISAAEKRF